MRHRRVDSVMRVLADRNPLKGMAIGGLGVGFAAIFSEALAGKEPKVGADIEDGPVANNGETIVRFVDGVPVIEETRRARRARRLAENEGEGDGAEADTTSGSPADSSGGATNLAFVS